MIAECWVLEEMFVYRKFVIFAHRCHLLLLRGRSVDENSPMRTGSTTPLREKGAVFWGCFSFVFPWLFISCVSVSLCLLSSLLSLCQLSVLLPISPAVCNILLSPCSTYSLSCHSSSDQHCFSSLCLPLILLSFTFYSYICLCSESNHFQIWYFYFELCKITDRKPDFCIFWFE